MSKVAQRIATLGPAGYFPIAPGTVGSAIAAIIWWFWLGKLGLPIQIVATLCLLPLAIWSAHQAEKNLGHDAHPIIIDEVVGQWITLMAAPMGVFWIFAGFILFRIFDVIKPTPVRESQKFPGGWGIVIDDVLAGIYSVICLLLGRMLIHG